jgi:hypothetical protein
MTRSPLYKRTLQFVSAILAWPLAAGAQHVDVAARGGESPAMVGSGNDGSANYGYQFQLPPSGGRFQPSLALSYSSNSHRQMYGVGWSLTENYIEARQDGTPASDGHLQKRYYLVRRSRKRLHLSSPFHPAGDDSLVPINSQRRRWQQRSVHIYVFTN